MDLSIVVPLYNEERNVPLVYAAIADALSGLSQALEIIFVDDGSSDRTFSEAAQLAASDPRLRVVKFRRRYGQTPAMAAGIDVARGRTVVTLDGDLQNDPADIRLLLARIEEGYDIVVGWRHDRKDRLLSRKLPSQVANWLIGKVTGISIRDNGCSLKAFRADVIKQLPLYSEMHRFIPAVASIAGPDIAEVKVRHHPRQFGKSKYGLSRVYEVLLSLLVIKAVVGFSARPLKSFAMLAIPIFLLSFVLVVGSVIAAFTGAFTALPMAGSGLFFSSLGVYLVFSGLLAELISKTSHTPVTHFPLLTAEEIPIDRTNAYRILQKPGTAVEY